MLDLAASPVEVAPQLLGAYIDVAGVRVRLTEVEAYCGKVDPGSHAFRGRTERNNSLYLAPGHAYVYFTYGMHYCLNLVAWPEGTAGGVLLRAGEVVEGLEIARQRRPGVIRDRELARGPANLVRCLGIDHSADGSPITLDGVLFDDAAAPDDVVVAVTSREGPAPGTIRSGGRVGVSGIGGDGQAFPWRYWIDGDPTVSAYRRAAPPRRRSAKRS
ncbi:MULTISPECIES: DNA-3-methyladenine glycosylase [unclassified Actinobaculum]|uniref:DNA-3-methyladenine glycosylase n=1 Tax=unclassified Actinobaculum TaxID=2609299 RepID=UPI000D526A14|nr:MULTISPECIES: DNA-3-methyladenine glycosylase [unclassified Actinobaculum]AWE42455.1 DNA-3-methyladenine glycosylase [Actinobaculum sp. 313]RTE48682.1 DNA-3-methyladenine glycosylase [Actinobaculum sp. 352]